MDRNSMNDTASAAPDPQTRELTEAELDAVSGGGGGLWSGRVENATAISASLGGHGAG
jgi:hypothetical protein